MSTEWIELDPVYIDPVPHVSGRYGAPMGRHSGRLDPDSPHWRATRLYAVQDGVGNVVYVDARGTDDAIRVARRED